MVRGIAGTEFSEKQHEIEWSTTPAIQQVASAASTNLTAGSVTPTFPSGCIIVRALLVGSIHASNQSANDHNVIFKIEGQRAAGGYSTLLDLTAQAGLSVGASSGAVDGWAGSVDITSLVTTSAVQYDFRFVIDSDDANNINYTTGFTMALVYRI